MTNVILKALGIEGMVGGQVLDLEGEGREVSEEKVWEIYRKKTGSFYRFYSMRSNSWFRSFPGKKKFWKTLACFWGVFSN